MKKIMNRIIILALVLALTNCSSYRQRVNTSIDYIDSLKENVLLVRLKTKENKAAQLAKLEGRKYAAAERKEVAMTNLNIASLFREYYNFSDVYFFFSDDGTALKAGDIKQVTFYDAALEEVDNALLKDKAYLVAEFGFAYESQLIYEDDEGNRRAAAGTNSTPALVVMDKDYIQLEKPFPSEVSDLNPAKRDLVVRELNEALHTFYLQAQKKKLRREMKRQKKALKANSEY